MHLVHTTSGESKEMRASELETQGIPIIISPFFTLLWPQDPKNQTLKPRMAMSNTAKSASWRRMQLTSPPMLQLDMSLWITKSNGKGTQLRPSTGKVAIGVTLGHLADLLASVGRGLTLHWIQIDGYAWWMRSADAIVVPKEGETSNYDGMRGVYVNPSNGIPFPGAF